VSHTAPKLSGSYPNSSVGDPHAYENCKTSSQGADTSHGSDMTMKLAGDLAEFSLADLVQVAGVAGRTCCVRVLAADGNGTLYLQGGEVVSAVFEDLSGFDAFVALVAARAGHFQVENGVYIVPKIIDSGYLAVGKKKITFTRRG